MWLVELQRARAPWLNSEVEEETEAHPKTDPAAFARKGRLLWLSVGTVELGRMRAGLQGLHDSLDEAKIQHVFYESPGTDHEWQTWRPDLKDLAPGLF